MTDVSRHVNDTVALVPVENSYKLAQIELASCLSIVTNVDKIKIPIFAASPLLLNPEQMMHDNCVSTLKYSYTNCVQRIDCIQT